MKSAATMRVKFRIHELLNSMGLHVRSFANALQHQDPFDLTRTFRGLRQCGFMPELVVDVGARQGSWSFLVSRIWPGTYFLLIEPQTDYENRLDLSFLRARWLDVAIDRTPGTKPFYIPTDKSSASLIRSQFANEEVQWGSVITMPLSHVIETELGGVVPQMIKVDAEGKDMDVILSLGSDIKKVDVCFVEASLPLNSRISNLERTLTIMRDLGFSLVDIGFAARDKGHKLLSAAELCFVREESQLSKGLTASESRLVR